MIRLARNVLIILITIAILALLWGFRGALVLFLLSVLFAAAARPVVSNLVARGMNRSLALLLGYLVFIAVLIGLVVVVSPAFVRELQTITDRFVVYYGEVWETWPEGNQFQRSIVGQLPDPNTLFNVSTLDTQNPLLDSVLGFTFGTFSVLGQVILGLILSIYWTADRVRFERLWLSLLPAEARMRARATWRDVEEGVGAYTRSQVLQSIIAGVLLGVGFSLMGVPYPTLLAFIGAIAWLIPWVGLLIVLILVFISASSISILLAVLASVYTLGILLILQLFIEPRFFERERFSSLLMLLLVIGMGSAFGLIGIIVGPPIAASIQLIARHISRQAPQSLTNESLRQIAELDQHLSVLEEKLKTMEEEPSQQVVNIIDRLNDLVLRAKTVVEDEHDRVHFSDQDDKTPHTGRIIQ